MEKQIKVVLVDDNEVTLKGIKEYFKWNDKIKIVTSFNDGFEARNYLINNYSDYDVVILDVILAKYDGFKLMEEINNHNLKKKVIVLSSFKDEYTVRKSQLLGANYFMLKPIEMEIIEKRIIELINHTNEFKMDSSKSIEFELSTLLHDLGIPSHILGYKYIREGIMLLYNCDDLGVLVTKEIYPKIALKYQTTTSRVERAIRHAIEISWARGDIELMEEIFGNSIDFDRSKPTNSEFMTTIADRFKLNNKLMLA